MLRGQRVRLYPNRVQEVYLRRACGVARFAYNWALGIRQWYYQTFRKNISTARLQKHWNKVKGYRFPWVTEVTKHAVEHAFRNLDTAFTNFFAGRAKYPRFKRKGVHDAFCAGRNSKGSPAFRVQGTHLILPRIGKVRFRNDLRWPAVVLRSVRVIHKAGLWFASILMDVPEPAKLIPGRPACGIDLGCTTFATISTQGVITEELKPPKPYAKAKRRLKRLQRRVSRKVKRGQNRKKAITLLGRQHLRVANVRDNFLHQFTTRLVRRYGTIVLEDLNIRGMVKNHSLAGTIADLGWGEFRRQVTYKAEVTGTKVVIADRWFPSSKRCSCCGYILKELDLSCRTWTCPQCGVTHDREHNAAHNVEQYPSLYSEKLGAGSPEVTPGETGVQATPVMGAAGAGRRTRNAKKTPQGDF